MNFSSSSFRMNEFASALEGNTQWHGHLEALHILNKRTITKFSYFGGQPKSAIIKHISNTIHRIYKSNFIPFQIAVKIWYITEKLWYLLYIPNIKRIFFTPNCKHNQLSKYCSYFYLMAVNWFHTQLLFDWFTQFTLHQDIFEDR